MAKRFVTYNGTKAAFAAAKTSGGVAYPTHYNESIVFITGEATGDSPSSVCIYTHGTYFGDIHELLTAVQYIKGVTDSTGTPLVTGTSGGVIPFLSGTRAFIGDTVAKATTDITVNEKGVTINLSEGFVKGVNQIFDDLSDLTLLVGENGDDAEEDGSVFAQINWLKAQIGTGGGVASQIQDAIDKITGTLDTGDAKTLAAINDELDDIIEQITPYSSGYDSIADQVDELETLVGQHTAAIPVTVEKQSPAESGYAATYVVKQGGIQVGVKINIPKDQFLKAATLVKGTWSGDTFTPSDTGTGKAIKLEMMIDGSDSDTTADILYINVADLVDVYTAKANAGEGEVQIAISDDNVVSATLVDKAITTVKINDLAVTEAKLGASAVTTAKIKDGNVTLAKLDNTTTVENSVTDKLVYKVTWANSGSIPSSTVTAISRGAAVMMNVNGTYYPARYTNMATAGHRLECVVNNTIFRIDIAYSATNSVHTFSGSREGYELTAEYIGFTDTNNHYASDTVAAALVELGWELGWEELS